MSVATLMLSALFATSSAAAQSFLDCHFAPGWEQSGAIRHFDSSNLYDYKDGSAEGYLIFGFVSMSTIDCRSGANTLAIDVSEMAGDDAAYGVFAANLDPAQSITRVGMGGQIQAQSASLAKGKYYVEIVETAADPSVDDSATMRAFATAIDARLEGRASPPEPLQWFLQQNLISTRIVPESVLGLRELKRGYVARYQLGQAFIVLEDSPEAAAQTFKSLRTYFSGAAPAQIGDEAFEIKAQYLDGVCIFRKGRILAGYANLPTPQQAATQATALAARIP
jgi:hypothetical protein